MTGQEMLHEKVKGPTRHGLLELELFLPVRVLRDETIKASVKATLPSESKLPSDMLLAFNISLRDSDSHTVVDGLRGSLTSSPQYPEGHSGQLIAVFNDITITRVGQYRVRVLLAASSPSQVIILGRVDSDIVEVN
ncbi:hypothetical protein BDV41DRAFT_575133 [Aspergillus transmontanensis]|uniref:Velvet domain-containing protein n=1 Tax=Aspergillus transmontanensis TaxID=1034304 RepID=A0A5N6W2T0_9EURO|nr:hypothetical protein BDV41DRAFT_575133 [Aspergillus transmontanensis]